MPMAPPPKKEDPKKEAPDYEPRTGLAAPPATMNKARSTTVKDDRSELVREFSRQFKGAHWFHVNQIMKIAEVAISNDRQWQIVRTWLLDLFNQEEKVVKEIFSKLSDR